MSSLVTTGPKSWTRPYAIYNGPRTGDAFLEWNMGQLQAPQPQLQWTEPPEDLDVLYAMGQLWDMGQVDQLFGAATKLFGDSVEAIEFRSQVTPPIVVNKPFAPVAPGQSPDSRVQGASPLTTVILNKAAKPAMYVHLTGGTVYPVEPYGKPTEDYTGLMLAGAGLTLALGAFIGIKIGQKFFCKK